MEQIFSELQQKAWDVRLNDTGSGDWGKQWFLDGERGTVKNTDKGMVFSAGPVPEDHGSHAVLWTQQSFEGDIRIEFDYTRLDTITRFVNILYIQATGKGEAPYVADIADWSDLRQIPYMASYFNTMNLLHVSFAAFGNQDDRDEDYVRARRYPTRPDCGFNQTDISPDYFCTGLFQPGVEHHFTFIKTTDDLLFEVRTAETRKLFHWPLGDVAPVTFGRVGIRHMWTRCSRYANVTISTC